MVTEDPAIPRSHSLNPFRNATLTVCPGNENRSTKVKQKSGRYALFANGTSKQIKLIKFALAAGSNSIMATASPKTHLNDP